MLRQQRSEALLVDVDVGVRAVLGFFQFLLEPIAFGEQGLLLGAGFPRGLFLLRPALGFFTAPLFDRGLILLKCG